MISGGQQNSLQLAKQFEPALDPNDYPSLSVICHMSVIMSSQFEQQRALIGSLFILCRNIF
jgi:hypothetical protein